MVAQGWAKAFLNAFLGGSWVLSRAAKVLGDNLE